jgi:indole-3-glycerol phosphate synthase
MSVPLADILARIAAVKRVEVAEKLRFRDSLERTAEAQRGQRRGFRVALAARRPSIIAEIKQASPSKGLLSADFNPARQAAQYFAGGASALSVLTDRQFFQGSLGDLKLARASAAVPVLRKDFIIDAIDVIEAAAAGADAILLIVALLSREEIESLQRLAAHYGVDALVEVHNDAELDVAIEAGATLVGVNNRDLRTFAVSLDTAERLAARMPGDVLKVAESGIHDCQDVRRLLDCGFQSFLVGEHLMTAPDPAAALRALTLR